MLFQVPLIRGELHQAILRHE